MATGVWRPSRGTWLARLYVGHGRYLRQDLGIADDLTEADGASTLTFGQAQERALVWLTERQQQVDAERAGGPALAKLTVTAVVEAYLAVRERRSRTRGQDARWRLTKHVLTDKKLAVVPLPRLTRTDLVAWRTRLPVMAPATVNRLLNDLRAAVTAACEAHPTMPASVLIGAKAALRSVADATEARDIQVLSPNDIRRLVDTAYALDESLGRLVLVLAATGTRVSQAVRITVADVQRQAGRILVPRSAKGRSDKARKPAGVPVTADVIARLESALIGRQGLDPLLVRRDGSSWAEGSKMNRPWRRVVSAAGLPIDTVPYALRHANIVRQLAAGVPVRFVAQIHDTSVAMIERHYSRFITSEVETAVRATLEPMHGGDRP